MKDIKPDKYQKKAIKSNKNTLILAGAGSGKTYTIIEKIKYLIKNNILPEEILCISFTKKSSKDLEEKLNKQKIDIKVYTFHSLGYEIINRYKKVKLVKTKTLGNIIEKELKKCKHIIEITQAKFITFGTKDKYIRKLQSNIILNTSYKNNIEKTIETFINLFKSNECTDKDITKFKIINENNNIYYQKKRHKYFLNLIETIIKKYEIILKKNNEIDYNDMINTATKIVNKKKIFNYKYIMIDEYQDISMNKLKLIKEIQKKTNAKIIAVGDDYQSIYSFTGSNIEIITNFKYYFPKAKIIKLKKTYRNSKELLKITQKFICKNPYQIKKKLKSSKNNKTPIIIYYYKNNIEEIWDKIIDKVKNDKVLIIGRNNNDIEKIPYLKKNMKYMTIHKSKGIETDSTIIINLQNEKNSLPDQKKENEYLIYVKPKIDEYKYSEERRLFYVALTRCKNNNILLVKKDNPSVFIKEIIKDNKNIKIIN